jgi:GntR family transcriptional regulator
MARFGYLSPLFTWRGAIASDDGPRDHTLSLKDGGTVAVKGATMRQVALALSLHMNERGGSCFPGVPLLARETLLHERTVQRAIAGLQDLGWLEVTRRPRPGERDETNVYTATIPPQLAALTSGGEGGATPPRRVAWSTGEGGVTPPEDVKRERSDARTRAGTYGRAGAHAREQPSGEIDLWRIEIIRDSGEVGTLSPPDEQTARATVERLRAQAAPGDLIELLHKTYDRGEWVVVGP